MSRHRFCALDSVIDEVHALLDTWADGDALGTSMDEDGMYVLRLAVHEWIANLVQHAHFPGPTEIVLTAEPDGDGIRCTVEDASAGFDFASQLDAQTALLDAPAPSERGRGLLMLITCSEDLGFVPAGPGQRQTIAFTVRNGVGGAVLAPLFRPEDLADDHTLTQDDAVGLGTPPLPAPPFAAPAPLGRCTAGTAPAASAPVLPRRP